MGIFNKNSEKKITVKKATAKNGAPVKPVLKEEKPVEKKKIEKKELTQAYRIFKKPHITEKSTDLSARLNQYIFVVAPEATKNEVKKAVQDLYGVTVEKVNIIKIPGKKRRLGKNQGFKSGYKKAIVFLTAGQQIEVISR